MKNVLLLFMLLLGAAGVFAQDFHLEGRAAAGVRSAALDKSFTDFRIVRMDAGKFLRFAAQGKASFTLRLQLEGARPVDMALTRSQLLADDYATIEASPRGEKRSSAKPAVYTYQGALTQNAAGCAAITVAENFIYGAFKQDGHTYYLEPLWQMDNTQPKDLYVFYDNGDVVSDPSVRCAPVEVKHQGQHLAEDEKQYCQPMLARLAIASDYTMYVVYGSVNAVVAHNLAIMNLVQANFDDEFDASLHFSIVANWVSTSMDTDPANDPDPVVYLGQFRDWANAGGFGTTDFALAHLRTQNIFPGTYATSYQGGICQHDYRFGFMTEFHSLACKLQTQAAHEIGHSLNATHAFSGIMLGGTSCQNTWDPISVWQINNTIAAGINCLQPVACTPIWSIPQPPALDYICGTDTWCYTFNLPCVNSFEVSTTNMNLEVSSTGQTICLQSQNYAKYMAKVLVTAIDYCGKPVGSTVWLVHVNYENCVGLQAGASDRQQVSANTADGKLMIGQNNDYILVQDNSADPRTKEIAIYDLSGRLLIHQMANGTQVSVPLEGFPQGMLIVRVQAAGETAITKAYHF